MNHISKTERNIRALLILGISLSFIATVFGGLALWYYFYNKPNITIPTWKFAQYILFWGLANGFVYFGILFLTRKADPNLSSDKT